jgi:hypothetical protein
MYPLIEYADGTEGRGGGIYIQYSSTGQVIKSPLIRMVLTFIVVNAVVSTTSNLYHERTGVSVFLNNLAACNLSHSKQAAPTCYPFVK